MSTQTEKNHILPGNGTHYDTAECGVLPASGGATNTSTDETRIVAAALGGAILGASLGGTLGALVVGGLGAAIASQTKK